MALNLKTQNKTKGWPSMVTFRYSTAMSRTSGSEAPAVIRVPSAQRRAGVLVAGDLSLKTNAEGGAYTPPHSPSLCFGEGLRLAIAGSIAVRMFFGTKNQKERFLNTCYL